MLLEAKKLLDSLDAELTQLRSQITITPALALLWIGEDIETGKFVRAKQKMAKELRCNFFLHHFPSVSERQLLAVLSSLNAKKDINGIVVQLPLPKTIPTDTVIAAINPIKDIDGLAAGSTTNPAPTPTGIIELLQHNQIDLAKVKTCILGSGRLVGAPLGKLFKQHNWNFIQIDSNAEKQAEKIKTAEVLIAATGQANIVTADMVHPSMVVVDGSGVDVNFQQISPLVAKITPAKGAIGPLTVRYLFKNLLTSALLSQKS